MIIVILFATSMMVIQLMRGCAPHFPKMQVPAILEIDDDGDNHDDNGEDQHGDNGDDYDVPHFPKMHVPGIPDPSFPP